MIHPPLQLALEKRSRRAPRFENTCHGSIFSVASKQVSAFASTRERVGLRNENEAMGRKVTAQKDWPLHPLHLLLLLLPSTERNEIAATCATIKCYRVGGRGLFPFGEDRIARGSGSVIRFDRCDFEKRILDETGGILSMRRDRLKIGRNDEFWEG